MAESRVEFRQFHHVTLAVPDLAGAVAGWTEHLGWHPDTTSSDRVTFPLEGAFVELVPAGGPGGPAPGVASVSVVVDDVEATARRIEAAGVAVIRNVEGSVAVDPSTLTRVPLEIRGGDVEPPRHRQGPFRRINHVVVAVADDEAAKNSWATIFGGWPAQGHHEREVAHHLPVGIAWFGLTSAGTDSNALARFLERRGEGVYALALVADDQPATIAELEERGARLIGGSGSGSGSSQTFVHPSTTHGLLIDVVPERHPSRLG